jgi:hypothetical protein
MKARQRPGHAGRVGNRKPRRQAEILRKPQGQIGEQFFFAAEKMRRPFDIEEQAVGAVLFAPGRGGRRVARRPQREAAERCVIGCGIDRARLHAAGFGARVRQRLAERKPRGLGRFVQRGDARSARSGNGKHKRFVRINRRGGGMVRARLFRLRCEKSQDRPARQPD